MSQKGYSTVFIIIGLVFSLAVLGAGYYLFTLSNNGRSENSISNTDNLIPLATQAPHKAGPTVFPVTVSPTVTLKKFSLIPTNNWKKVALKGVAFRIPDTWSCNDDSACSLIYAFGVKSNPQKVSVEKYNGGSRRDQYLSGIKDDCKWIFEEGLYGEIKGLGIAADGGWCQGGAGAIVVVVGDKYVTFDGLTYDPQTKEITHSPVMDTIISTLE